MRLPIVLLVLAICQVSVSVGVYGRENGKLRSVFGSRNEFMNRVQDWFRHVKERIYSRWFGTDTTLPLGTKGSAKTENIEPPVSPNSERFFLDMSSLSFDPNQDWGFRMGNWYFIRKSGENTSDPTKNPDEWNMQLTTEPEKLSSKKIDWNSHEGQTTSLGTTQPPSTKTEIDMTLNDDITTESTQPQSSVSTTESITTQTVMQSMTHSDANDNPVTETTKTIRENETDNDRVNSAEVLM